MIGRSCFARRFLAGVCLLACAGCSHRQSSATAAVPPVKAAVVPQMLSVMTDQPKTFKGPGVQFDYPADWVPVKGQTACFAITAPGGETAPSLCLDVPKLPWHVPGFLSVGMVASGYISDLKKSSIHDAVVKEESSVSVCGETGRRITCTGHIAGKSSTDVAVVVVHADRVYILSADSDENGCDCARKTLDAAVASMKWMK